MNVLYIYECGMVCILLSVGAFGSIKHLINRSKCLYALLCRRLWQAEMILFTVTDINNSNY